MAKSRTIRLRQDRAGRGLDPGIFKGWRYWDGWIDDARMVIALLRDAEARGATLFPRIAATHAERAGGGWRITLSDERTVEARHLVNATGPWAERTAREIMQVEDLPALRLVQGSHIVVERPTSAEDALMIQQPDKRVVFMVPLGDEHLMIGTTETPLSAMPATPSPTRDEIVYLLMAANQVLAKPIAVADIVHTVAGVRPLVVDPGKDAREPSRDWRLHMHEAGHALTVVGGKITTHRLLAEDVLARLQPSTKPWTAGETLPGGDFQPRPGERNRDAHARSEEHTSELQSLMRISYAVFCLKKKQQTLKPTKR